MLCLIQQQELLKILNQAIIDNEKDSGKIDFQHIKIFLTGSAAAGKTSFRRLLLNVKFDEEYTSTEFQETEHVYAMMLKSNENSTQWIHLTAKEQIDYFNSLLKFRCKKATKDEEKKANDPTTCTSSGDDEDETIDKIKEEILVSKGLPGNLNIGDTVKLITIVDTGGQPGYIHLLPILNFSNSSILSCLTINFVVHDMTKSLDDPVMVRYREKGQDETKAYELQYTNKELIKQLMSVTATITCTSSTPKTLKQQNVKSLIGFIGTHKDELDSKHNDIVRSFDKQIEELVKEQGHTNNTLNTGGHFKYIFAVDNKDDEDNIAQQIRSAIEALPKRKSDKLPIAWLILELEVKYFCESETIPCISFNKYSEIARKKAKIADEKNVHLSLEYFHTVGVFLYFLALRDPGVIIVNHQWFYNQLSKLVCFPLGDISFSTVHHEEQFENQGILPKNILERIEVGLSVETGDHSIKLETHHFIKLLNDMKILATFKNKTDKEELCYLPYFRPYCNLKKDKYKYLLLEPFLIRISPGCIPRGFFSCLIVNLLQSNDFNPLHGEEQCRNVMVFLYSHKYCLKLCDKIRYLEVQVRHSTYCQKESMYPLFEKLHQHLENMCKTWKIDMKKLQYGFVCHDCEHMMVIPSMKDPKSCNMDAIGKKHCEKCHKDTEIGKRHRMWLNGELHCSSIMYIILYILFKACTCGMPSRC